MWSGIWPSRFRTCVIEPCSSKYSYNGNFPILRRYTVCPSLPPGTHHAPQRAAQTSGFGFPLHDAPRIGVKRSLRRAWTFAPWSRSDRTAATFLFPTAICRGVLWLSIFASRSSPRSSKSRTTSEFPLPARCCKVWRCIEMFVPGIDNCAMLKQQSCSGENRRSSLPEWGGHVIVIPRCCIRAVIE